MELELLWRPSPNFGVRPDGVEPELVVIHGTVGSDQGDLAWLTGPYSGVSYHYLITRDGKVYYLVREMHRAWHAGESSWSGRPNVNDYSIGIALSNRGPGEPYTDAQYRSLGILSADIAHRYDLRFIDFVGHNQVSPGRKFDPWDHFNWERFYGEMFDVLYPRVVPGVVRHPKAHPVIIHIKQ